ncbi:MAG: restriction endonuclease subunit S [Brevibacterium aurantiacum]
MTGNRVVLNLTGQDTMKAVRKGDFIIHLRSFQGGLEGSSLDGKVSAAYTVLKPAGDLNNSYYQYLLKSKAFVDELANLTFQLRDGQTVNYARFARMALPVPPLHTQQRIADYLDRETGEIDAMIAKMDQLAEQLEARRKSAISAQLVDHQLVACSLGILFSFHNGDRGANYPSRDEFVTSGIPFINAGHLVDQAVSQVDMNFITEVHFSRMGGAKLVPGDILFCLRGSVGKFATFSDPFRTGALASSLVAMRARSSALNHRYITYVLSSAEFAADVVLSMTGSAQPNLSVEQLAQLQVPLPTVDEQRRIADHLDQVTSHIDQMLAKVAELRSLLAERRAALVTEVVTGRKEVA